MQFFLRSVIFPYNSLYTQLQVIAYTAYFELGEPVIGTTVDGKVFSKINKLTERNGGCRFCFRLMTDWKLESLTNGKEISAVLLSERKRGLPLQVVYNSRTDFPQNYCSI